MSMSTATAAGGGSAAQQLLHCSHVQLGRALQNPCNSRQPARQRQDRVLSAATRHCCMQQPAPAAGGCSGNPLRPGSGRRPHPLRTSVRDGPFASVDLSPLLASPPEPPPGGGLPSPSSEDQDKEDSRKFRRTVFDFQRWREHRSTNRYVRHLTGIWGSRIVRGLAAPLWIITGLSLAVCGYESLQEAGSLPEAFQSISVANTEPFNLSSFALSLLLVFRTNSSYARWEEARRTWGGVVNRSRDLLRQADSWFPESEGELLDMVQRWVVAYSRSLQSHLREDGNVEAELQGILPEHELAKLVSAQHRPNYVLAVLSCAIEEAHIPDAARVRLDENVTFFADALGACERILKTPIPLTYTRHTSRFLVIWLTFMPFTLWHACGWGTVPASIAIAFLLLGIEEIGVQIEEPFAILPLENMCATITRDCIEMHSQRHEVRSLVTDVRPMNGNQEGPADLRPKHERRKTRYCSPRRREIDGDSSGEWDFDRTEGAS